MLTPFMVAMAPETAAQQPAAPAAVYNWENQGSVDIISKEDGKNYTTGTFSYPPGESKITVVDDWHLC